MFFGKRKTVGHDFDESIAENVEKKEEEAAEKQPFEEEAAEKQPSMGDEEVTQTGEPEAVSEKDGQETAQELPEEEDIENEEPSEAEEEQPEDETDDFDFIGESPAAVLPPKKMDEEQAQDAEDAAQEPEETDEEREQRLAERRRRLKKAAKIGGIAVGGLALVYLAGVVFYNSHFFFGTVIGNYNCSNMGLSKAEEHITTGIRNYTFAIYERNDEVEYIKGEEVGLATAAIESIEDIKAKQNPFMWPVFWKQRIIPMSVEISLDDELLKNKISTLRCVQQSEVQMDGAVAGIYYDENDKVYHVKDDGTHSIVSQRALFEKISGGMKGLYADMYLEQEGLYGGLETDDIMNDTLWILNNCLNAVVTYQRGDETSVLDSGTIHTWLSVGDDYSVSLNDEAVASFVRDLAGLYDTVGSTRTFIGSAGAEVSVSGGDYGWRINQSAEIAELKNIIMAGQPVTREPIYSRTAGSHNHGNDLPNTYIEVSIAAQHLWYYKDGELLISSDVVTGNPYSGNGTHTGIYYIKYKEKDATLKGEDYETPVSFWMPFNGGEGLHDATWRGAFGGRIYMGGGSHGCVNCPYSVAKSLFENIQQGDPVIVY